MRYSLLFFCFLFACCSNNGTTSTADDTTGTATAPANTEVMDTSANRTCYAYQSANDTVLLTLTASGPKVSGNLIYGYSGKDKNSGTIAGTMKGDTLIADYTFISEGKSSVRQVAFLKNGDGFVEGYGDSQAEGDKMVFKNTGTLKFGSTMMLQKRPCSSL